MCQTSSNKLNFWIKKLFELFSVFWRKFLFDLRCFFFLQLKCILFNFVNVRKVHCILASSQHTKKFSSSRLFLLFLYEILSCICAFFAALTEAETGKKNLWEKKAFGLLKIYAKRKCWWIEWRGIRENLKFDDFFWSGKPSRASWSWIGTCEWTTKHKFNLTVLIKP